jgi:hypothetical protein
MTRKLLLFFCLFVLFSCENKPSANSSAHENRPVTAYVFQGENPHNFSQDTLALLSKTIGKPLTFEEGEIHFTDEKNVYSVPLDSVMAWLEKPSLFRKPEKTLSAFLKGEAPEIFSFDLYDPANDDWVDSVSLQYYKLDYKSEDMTKLAPTGEVGKLYSILNKGYAQLVISNQGRDTVKILELEVEVEKRLKSGTNCVIESFTRTFMLEKDIPPFSQLSTTEASDSLSVKLKCNGFTRFEMPYKATFRLLRYQTDADTAWVDARKRELIAK